jgi:hypothetical protein
MEDGRAPAPDLFTALDWSAKVAPAGDVSSTAAVPPPVGATPAPMPPPIPAARPVIAASPSRRATPAVLPTLAPAPAPVPAPKASASSSFSGLADMLEPDAEASPALDEFDSLLDVFDDEPAVAASKPAPSRPAVAAAPPRAPAAMPLPKLAPALPRATPVLPRSAAPVLPRPAAVGTDVPTPIDFPAPGDPAESAQLTAPLESSALVSRVAPREADFLEPTASTRSFPWFWLALTLLLGGGLFWVLYSQTDLFSGDLIALRNQKVQAEAEQELAAQQREQESEAKEYGTIEIASEPKGARVFDVREGVEARFEALPVDHEYMVMVFAPGHVPRVRIVKGSELAAPVIVDLDALPAGAAAPPLPEERAPKLASAPSKQAETLVLRTHTPGATLGLLVGYTPGVKIIDVDVKAPQRYLLVLAGHDPAELIVKGRHFEEQGDALVYAETVTLVPSKPVADDEGDDDEVVVDEVATPISAGTPPPPAAAVGAPTPAVKAASPSKKKKKKKRKKRRR